MALHLHQTTHIGPIYLEGWTGSPDSTDPVMVVVQMEGERVGLTRDQATKLALAVAAYANGNWSEVAP